MDSQNEPPRSERSAFVENNVSQQNQNVNTEMFKMKESTVKTKSTLGLDASFKMSDHALKTTNPLENTGKSSIFKGVRLKTDPNFNTNAPPFEVRGPCGCLQ